MAELENVHFRDENEFRQWLEANGEKSQGIWMLYYKKHTGIRTIEYSDALDCALCYGWIDSIIRKIDDDIYARKFTPRTDIRKWSDVNKKRVEQLILDGKMTKAGLSKIESYVKTGKVTWTNDNQVKKPVIGHEIPFFIADELKRNEPAYANFCNLAPSFRKQYLLWITSAKREETKMNRLKESVILLKENRKLGLK